MEELRRKLRSLKDQIPSDDGKVKCEPCLRVSSHVQYARAQGKKNQKTTDRLFNSLASLYK